MALIRIPEYGHRRRSTASDKIARGKDTHARYHCFLWETGIRRQRLAKSDQVAKRKFGTLTDRRHNGDPSGQKNFFHPPRHHPVEVIDVLRGAGIFPINVVPAHRECSKNTKIHHNGTRVKVISVSLARSSTCQRRR